jgi:hypothetical protein
MRHVCGGKWFDKWLVMRECHFGKGAGLDSFLGVGPIALKRDGDPRNGLRQQGSAFGAACFWHD